MKCGLCSADGGGEMKDDSQQHLLECSVIINNCPELFNDFSVKYEDLFSPHPPKQLHATRLLQSALETRDRILTQNENEQ